jgi:hypothetical protein
MLDQADEDQAPDTPQALRDDAEYASLARHAVTDNGRALIAAVCQQVEDWEARQGTRKRKRLSKAPAFARAIEGFVADLLIAIAHKERAEGSVRRSVGRDAFTDEVVTYHDFNAIRHALVGLGLVEETPAIFHWNAQSRSATRWRATALLIEMAAAHSVSMPDIGNHFVTDLPKHPLVLKGHSGHAPDGDKIPGKKMKFAYTEKLRAMERAIIDLNAFIDRFELCGGTHRGFIRIFNCGDDPSFDWNLGGRLYSQEGDASYQQMGGAERLKMTIDGKRVCELDIKASYLTIFHAQGGQPLDLIANPDPYRHPELSAIPRDVVKAFITATFGNGRFPRRWSPKTVGAYGEKTGEDLRKYRISQVRKAVARAYPLLAKLRKDSGQAVDGRPPPPIWARLMYLESEAIFQTMLALKDLNIPSLPVHDSLIVTTDHEQTARETLSKLYSDITGAVPLIP